MDFIYNIKKELYHRNKSSIHLVQAPEDTIKINCNFRNTSFFHESNLNKSINELKHTVEEKRKIIDNLNTSTITKNTKNKHIDNLKLWKSLSVSSIFSCEGNKENNKKIVTKISKSVKENKFSSNHLVNVNYPLFTTRDNDYSSSVKSRDVDFIFKKIFDKKLLNKLHPKNKKVVLKSDLDEIKNKFQQDITNKEEKLKPKNYIDLKIKDIKNKLFVMKGVLDYSYPPIMVHKFKQVSHSHNIINNEHKINNDYNNSNNIEIINSNLKLLEKEKDQKRLNELFKKSIVVNNINYSQNRNNNTNSFRERTNILDIPLKNTMSKIYKNTSKSKFMLKKDDFGKINANTFNTLNRRTHSLIY